MEATPFEERRLALEERRVAAEASKARLEARWGWITRLGVAVPLIVLALTLIYNGWQFRQAAEDTYTLEREKAGFDFQTRVVDILLSPDVPKGAHLKAQMVDELVNPGTFDEKLAPLVEPFDAGDKTDFISLIAAHPKEQGTIVALWKQLFPADTWVDELR